MTDDLLAGAVWECASMGPDLLASPEDLESARTWWPAQVPGTAALALRDAGVPGADVRDYDSEDWWFRTRFDVPSRGRWRLAAEGLATVADVWIDGRRVLHSENMFCRAERVVELDPGAHQIALRFAALTPLLDRRRPRPRWKTYLVRHQNLRWFRTTLLGRIPGWTVVPAPVGPWRPVTMTPAAALATRQVSLIARPEGTGGVVDVTFRVAAERCGLAGRNGRAASVPEPVVDVGGHTGAVSWREEDGDLVVESRVWLPQVARWWPHTHGAQPRYPVVATVGGRRLSLGRVGFRTVRIDEDGGAFRVVVNGEPVFCRGACWFPPDPYNPGAGGDEADRTLDLARRANLNMLRVPATGVYESRRFLDRCDELGILVWQDCTFAFMDPPEDDDFAAEVDHELHEVFTAMAGHPCVTVVCGGQEISSVAAMTGLPPDRWGVPLLEEQVPAALARALPDVAYVEQNPSGGTLPFQMDAGVCHYFGVGGYLRPLSDVRRSEVRFATECLALSTPPERHAVECHYGSAVPAGHEPAWKQSLHHDAGRSWDMEDVRHFYMRMVHGVDPLATRYEDAERALDLGRATNAALVTGVFSEWRRNGSSCSGGLLLAMRDLRPGAGWGLVDADGLPKSTWYALRRVSAPLAIALTDEGLNGLHCHVCNDTAEPFAGALRVTLFARGELAVDRGEEAVALAPRRKRTIDVGRLLGGFRDITYAYRFAPPAHDVVSVTLVDERGAAVADAVHLPLGHDRPQEPDVGLSAAAAKSESGWQVTVGTRRFAQWVSLEVPGYVPEDSWFHLAPGATRTVLLTPTAVPLTPTAMPLTPVDAKAPIAAAPRLRGRVRALNSQAEARITEVAADA